MILQHTVFPKLSSKKYQIYFFNDTGQLNTDSKISIPTGAMTLDEASMDTKVQCTAVTLNKRKPDKYNLRFYAVVGYMYQYCPSIFDCGRVNKTGQSNAARYCSVHRDIRRATYFLDSSYPLLKCSKSSSLRAAQTCHPNRIKSLKDIPGVGKIRYIFCDNLYTRHNMATHIKKLLD